jgi:hypothetical protein
VSKVNNCSIGENSPNLVTLSAEQKIIVGLPSSSRGDLENAIFLLLDADIK